MKNVEHAPISTGRPPYLKPSHAIPALSSALQLLSLLTGHVDHFAGFAGLILGEEEAGTNETPRCQGVFTGDQGTCPAWSVEVADTLVEASGGCIWRVDGFVMACNVVDCMDTR